MEIIRVKLCGEDSRGCEKAPVEILKELRKIGSSENGKEINLDKLNLEEIHVDLENFDEANHLIFENSREAFEKNFKTFFIGGDGSICYSIVKAFEKIVDGGLLVVFDAHGDCLEDGDDSVTWLRKLIESGFSGGRVILIGARNLSMDERKFLKENKVTLISMDVLQEDLHEISDLVMERCRSSKGFYVSLDIDCLDLAYAPGVNRGEVGGLSSRDLIYFLKRLKMLDNFKGMDINGVDVDRDVGRVTIKVGAKLLGEMV